MRIESRHIGDRCMRIAFSLFILGGHVVTKKRRQDEDWNEKVHQIVHPDPSKDLLFILVSPCVTIFLLIDRQIIVLLLLHVLNDFIKFIVK